MTSQIASVAEMIKQELENFKFMDPFMKTYNNIKTVSDTWNQLIDQINKVMLATEKSRDFAIINQYRSKYIYFIFKLSNFQNI